MSFSMTIELLNICEDIDHNYIHSIGFQNIFDYI